MTSDPLVIADPSLVVLIGAAGSGKSTLAARLFSPAEILSSDALRAAIAGDERDQRASGAAFRAIARALDRRLAARRTTAIDATNLRPTDWRPWLTAARRHATPTLAIVLDLPTAVVQARNAARDRVVDDVVVSRQLSMLRRTLDAGQHVGARFDLVVVLGSPAEVD
jgi:protein phosphatase